MRWILAQSANAWTFLRDLMTVLRPCRFSVLIVVAGAALLFSPQGEEIAIRLPKEPFIKAVLFDLCVFLWALQSWYWSRLLLDFTFEPDRKAHLNHPREQRIRWFIKHVPRAIGVASYLVAILAASLAGATGSWRITAALVVEAFAFLLLVVYRRTLIEKHQTHGAAPAPQPRANPPAQQPKDRLLEFFFKRGANPSALRSLPPCAYFFLGVTFVLVIGSTIWVCADPVSFGWFFGAAGVPFLGFSMIVPVGSFLILMTREGGAQRASGASALPSDTAQGYPVVTTLLIIAIVFSWFPALDNHGVRTLASTNAPAQALSDYLDRWHEQAPRLADGRSNLIVVAAAGGGLRAAYWTATVLGAIQDGDPEFHKQLVGISGVSGGSLGAATFVALLDQASAIAGTNTKELSECRARASKPSPGLYECSGQAVLGRDFLGPTVAALLFPDLMHRFLPLGFPDRAKALEQAWERAWKKAELPEPNWEERGFRAAWQRTKGHLPALFLNGTHVESGRRIITSHIDIGNLPGVFRDVHDFFAFGPADSKAPMDIRFSTAAHNSARFTYVSPAGTLPGGTHLVDGGYFENFGAVTVRELLQAAMYHKNAKTGESMRIRPIVIVISNDPGLEESDFPSKPSSTPRIPEPKSFGGEVLSPLRALLKTRDARGLLAVSELRQVAENHDGEYFQFLLCEMKDLRKPALGWVLSADGETAMQEQIHEPTQAPDQTRDRSCKDDTRKKNHVELKRLLATLAGRDLEAKPK